MRPLRTATLALLLMPCLACAAEEKPEDPSAQVVIKGIRNPELKTYRVMAAGLDAFDDRHALAPAAEELRFRLRARGGRASVDMDGLALRLAGEETSIPLPLAPDNSFVLPRNAQAARDNAELILNKPKGGYSWQPEIRSAGVPDGMRRLGDLRLECVVLVAVAKKEIGLLLTAFINSLLLTTDWCGHEKIHMATTVVRRLHGATLIDGEERVPVEVAEDGWSYRPPLQEKRYGDETLIELQYEE